MSDETHLSTHFDALGLPAPAKAWLLDLWTVIHVLDDAADGDKSADAGRAAMAIFWDMPLNPFYQANFAALQPVLKLQVLKWIAANVAEENGLADERSYMWRAGFYDVVTMVCALCGGDQGAGVGLSLYGETFTEYMEGF